MGTSYTLPQVPAEPPSGVYVDVRAARNYVRPKKSGFTVYELHFRYQQFTWTVTKRFSEICSFHSRTKKRVMGFFLKRPKKTFGFSRDLRNGFVKRRLEQLRPYLKLAFGREDVWALQTTKEFAGVSSHSFDWKLGYKSLEGWLHKRAGGRLNTSNPMIRNWRRRWFMIKDNFVAYFEKPTDEVPRGVMLIDEGFSAQPLSDRYIQLSNRTRKLMLRTPSYRHTCEWADALREVCARNWRLRAHPNGSFAPVRHYSPAAWYVGGAAAFAAMAKAMEEATSEIFISDWWLSPDVQLVRRRPWQPGPTGEPCGTEVALRVRDILWRKQGCGVKIYVLLYKEIGYVMHNKSKSAKSILLNLGNKTNIFVMRHPDHMSLSKTRSLYWTHHDKMCIVDQKLAFMGGVDMCYGRYDTWRHHLGDHPNPKQALWPGEDFYNPCAAESVGSTRKVKEALSAAKQRVSELMTQAGDAPGVGVAVDGLKLATATTLAATSSTLERLATAAGVQVPGRSPSPPPVPPRASLPPPAAAETKGEEDIPTAVRVKEGAAGDSSIPTAVLADTGAGVGEAADTSASAGGGVEETKADGRGLVASSSTAGGYIVPDEISLMTRLPDPNHHPRLPWHDIHMCVTGPAAVDLAAHFVQRWHHHRLSKGESEQPWIMPCSDQTGWWAQDLVPAQQARAAKASVEEPMVPTVVVEADAEPEPESAVARAPNPSATHGIAGVVTPDTFETAGSGPSDTSVVSPDTFEAATATRSRGGGDAPSARTSVKGAVTPHTFAPPPIPARRSKADSSRVAAVTRGGAVREGVGAGSGSGSGSGSGVGVGVHGGGGSDAESSDSDAVAMADLSAGARGAEAMMAVPSGAAVELDPTTGQPEQTVAGERAGSGIDSSRGIVEVRSDPAAPYFIKPFDIATKEALYEALHDSSGGHADCSVQILRSVAPWSAGVSKETSIHTAMVSLIKSAVHFIYIENQYFISSTADNSVKNEIVAALLERFKRAIDNGEAFRVIVVLPAHPEGDHHTNRSVQAVLHNMFHTIFAGPTSLLGSLRRHYPTVDLSEYISFYSLRQEGTLPNGHRVTEQVYVHSKLMIVDDRVAMIGSANINDRSLLGSRDSEVVALVSGGGAVESRMAGAPWVAGGFAFALRTRLWRAHLGHMETPDAEMPDLMDPVAPDTYFETWMKTALANTVYYEAVYPEVRALTQLTRGRSGVAATGPAGTVRRHNRTRDSYRAGLLPAFAEAAPVRAAAASAGAGSATPATPPVHGAGTGASAHAVVEEAPVEKPQGLLVCFSMGFRRGEDLRPEVFSPEGLTPAKVFQ